MNCIKLWKRNRMCNMGALKPQAMKCPPIQAFRVFLPPFKAACSTIFLSTKLSKN